MSRRRRSGQKFTGSRPVPAARGYAAPLCSAHRLRIIACMSTSCGRFPNAVGFLAFAVTIAGWPCVDAAILAVSAVEPADGAVQDGGDCEHAPGQGDKAPEGESPTAGLCVFPAGALVPGWRDSQTPWLRDLASACPKRSGVDPWPTNPYRARFAWIVAETRRVVRSLVAEAPQIRPHAPPRASESLMISRRT